MERVDLSVVAPCFDEAANVREPARRVLITFDEGGLRGELVLVDDASQDETRAVIEGLVAEHPARVVGCYHQHNQGIAEAWRTGIRAARAPLLAVIDADLQYQPEAAGVSRRTPPSTCPARLPQRALLPAAHAGLAARPAGHRRPRWEATFP
jgi:glycosyltransferase involved in cell wall biosynthesis